LAGTLGPWNVGVLDISTVAIVALVWRIKEVEVVRYTLTMVAARRTSE